MDTIKRPVTPLSLKPSKEVKTPTTVKGLRKFQRLCVEDPCTVKLKKLMRANEILLAKASLAEHRACGLLQALQIEKKKRQHGKQLGLKVNLARDETAHGQWWGALEIQKATTKLQEKETEEKVWAAEKE